MPIIAGTPSVDANIFFTYQNDEYETIGIAWTGSVCFKNTSWRASVTEYFQTDIQTAWVNVASTLYLTPVSCLYLTPVSCQPDGIIVYLGTQIRSHQF